MEEKKKIKISFQTFAFIIVASILFFLLIFEYFYFYNLIKKSYDDINISRGYAVTNNSVASYDNEQYTEYYNENNVISNVPTINTVDTIDVTDVVNSNEVLRSVKRAVDKESSDFKIAQEIANECIEAIKSSNWDIISSYGRYRYTKTEIAQLNQAKVSALEAILNEWELTEPENNKYVYEVYFYNTSSKSSEQWPYIEAGQNKINMYIEKIDGEWFVSWT